MKKFLDITLLLFFCGFANAFQVVNRNIHHGLPSVQSSLQENAVSSSRQSLLRKSARENTLKLSMWSSDELEGDDRIKACIPYVLPLLDGDYFGKYIYQRIPPLGTLDQIFIAPLTSILQSFPFLSLILFLLLSLGTRNVDGMSRNVRFNAQQAVLIDIALILPTIIYEGVEDVDVPRQLAEFGCNFVWYFYMSAIVYSVTMNLRGRKPNELPFISEAAELMTGPM